MTDVLVVYGTTDGQTRKVAQAIAKRLSMSGVAADVVRAGERAVSPARYGGIIVAGSVRAGRYQKRLEQWVRAHAAMLDACPNAFLSVSLAAQQKGDASVRAELDAIVRRFSERTGWRPGVIRHVAGALLYTRYNVITRWVMKRIVAKAGGETDTSRDYEYTDWNDVNAFADEFRRRLPAAA